jgi:hypothetical protein
MFIEKFQSFLLHGPCLILSFIEISKKFSVAPTDLEPVIHTILDDL